MLYLIELGGRCVLDPSLNLKELTNSGPFVANPSMWIDTPGLDCVRR